MTVQNFCFYFARRGMQVYVWPDVVFLRTLMVFPLAVFAPRACLLRLCAASQAGVPWCCGREAGRCGWKQKREWP